MGRLVVLDPGHGGSDPGAMPGEVREADVCLRVALKLQEELHRQYAVPTMLTRSGDYYLTQTARRRLAEDAGARMLVSIHLNSYTSFATGFEVWHRASPKLASAFSGALRIALPAVFPNRGVKVADWAVLRGKMPSVLLELGFMTDPKFMEFILGDDGVRSVAVELAKVAASLLRN